MTASGGSMSGPEHYRQAERLVYEAGASTDAGYDPEGAVILSQLAQVHATLAGAAAVQRIATTLATATKPADGLI